MLIIVEATGESFDWAGLVTAFTALGGLAFAASQAWHAMTAEDRRLAQADEVVRDLLEYYLSQLKITDAAVRDISTDGGTNSHLSAQYCAKTIDGITARAANFPVSGASSKAMIQKMDAEAYLAQTVEMLTLFGSSTKVRSYTELFEIIDKAVKFVTRCHADVSAKTRKRTVLSWVPDLIRKLRHAATPTAKAASEGRAQ